MKYQILTLLVCLLIASCSNDAKSNAGDKIHGDNKVMSNANLDTATFGGGCFWCVEAVFQELEGVEKVVSGYAGGRNANPTYKEVCTGTTGHAEVAQIYFDITKITYDELLLAFFSSHDPTTLNRQGGDEGTQYRSVVFYNSDAEKSATESMIKKLTEEQVYSSKIITEVSPMPVFYPAEDYHQNYFELNPNQSYCAAVINPKVTKFKKQFKENLKK